MRFLRGAAARLLLSGLVLCAIIIVTWPQVAMAASLRVGYVNTESNTQVLTALKNLYEATHRGEEVQLVPLTSRELQTHLPLWLTTGQTADVYFIPDTAITALKGQDVFLSMFEFRWLGFQFDQAFERFPQGVQEAFTGPRGPLGIPVIVDAQLFQVNQALFHQAGIAAVDHFTQGWDWNDMIDVGLRITQPSLRRYMLFIDPEFAFTYFLVHGEVASADLRSSRIANDANLGLLRLVQEAIHQYQISPPPSRQSNASRLFNDGLLALRRVRVSEMQPHVVAGSAAQWSRLDWDVAPWPLSPFTQLRPSLGEASGLVVSPASLALPQAELFLRVAISEEGQRAVAATGVGFPARIDLWQPVSGFDHQRPQNQHAFTLAFQNWKHFFITETTPGMDQAIMVLVGIMEGVVDAQSGLEQAHRLLDAALKE